jgi:NADPH:quinone reductase-like Zn-dependent oxidoreductase
VSCWRTRSAPLGQPPRSGHRTVRLGCDAAADLVEDSKVIPGVDQTYPLDQPPEAMRLLENSQVRGKIVITI